MTLLLVTLKHLVPFIAFSTHFHAQQYIFAFTSMVSSRYRLNLCLVVQLLSHVWIFAGPWTAACQAPLFSTISHNLLKFIYIELVMLSSHLILWHTLLFLPSIFPSIGSFPMSWLFTPEGQNIGASASVTVHPMNIQGWFHGKISLQSKGPSRVFSVTCIHILFLKKVLVKL